MKHISAISNMIICRCPFSLVGVLCLAIYYSPLHAEPRHSNLSLGDTTLVSSKENVNLQDSTLYNLLDKNLPLTGFNNGHQGYANKKNHFRRRIKASQANPGPANKSSTELKEIVHDQQRVVYNLVDKKLRVTTYDITRQGRAKRKQSFNKAIIEDEAADLRFILFTNAEQIATLDEQTKQTLLTQFNSGILVMGAADFGKNIKESLGLLDPSLANALSTTGGDGLWVLLHRSPAGHLNELVIAQPARFRRLRLYFDDDAFTLMRDWYNRNEVFTDSVLTDGDNPWDAIHNFEWSGVTLGDFENNDNQQAGTYKFTLSLYTVASDMNNDDWYRMDFQTISEITNYKMTGDKFGDTSGTCGWWTENMHASATVTTPNGQWWQFMPSSTVGSTTTSFSIGGNITTSQAGVNAGYSQSYGQPDVTIKVQANSVKEAIDWEASLVGCHNYSWYPDYSGASNVAHSTYNLSPSLIIAVPSGSPLTVETKAPDSDNNDEPWRFTIRKDTIKLCDAGFEVCSTQYTSEYSINKTITCTKTGCS